jgi:multisubunit Na+/H+ antiporter MnhG subunit
VITALVVLAVLVEILCCLGIVVMRTPLQRLHFIGPASVVGPVLIGIAVAFAKHPYPGSGFKAAFIALVLVVFSGMLQHETARAALAREVEAR